MKKKRGAICRGGAIRGGKKAKRVRKDCHDILGKTVERGRKGIGSRERFGEWFEGQKNAATREGNSHRKNKKDSDERWGGPWC